MSCSNEFIEPIDFECKDINVWVIREQYIKHIEARILKRLSEMGYNFDSYELRDMFAKDRLTIVTHASYPGANWLYLDGHIEVISWIDP